MSKSITIKRSEFESAGWRTIEVAQGKVVWPNGKVNEFRVRLQAMPGEEGDVYLVAEDINRPEVSNVSEIKLRKK